MALMERVRIYQLFVRLFGNTIETGEPNGSLLENGVGKFNHINEAALVSLKEMGFTHIWLTGVFPQATSTDHSEIGKPADDPDLLKGLAGSPYAIKDYFDVCADYAENPANRLEEFKALLGRIHQAGLKALIDFVPNHVARSYRSTVMPGLDFGATDDRTKFFDPGNNFYYLTPGNDGPPLRLPTLRNGEPVSPTCKVAGISCDGFFDGEKEFGRVTGNNAATWSPSSNDWYETVKLNYGWDFTTGRRAFPTENSPDTPVPDTWTKMDRVIDHWQSMGVDGFRCDMAHMIPQEFWAWVIARARERHSCVYFLGEAYDNDPAKVPSLTDGNVLLALLKAGFNAVYDHPAYQTLKRIHDGPSWANDLDSVAAEPEIFARAARYAENHDEVRVCSGGNWGGTGMKGGRVVSAILYGLSRGPVILYNGQEVGETGSGNAGFCQDHSRTTIFDYWSMPELLKWVNDHRYDGGKLSNEQKENRAFYKTLLNLIGQPAFSNGAFLPLNPANNSNLRFGSVEADAAGGHWMYAFLRHDNESGQRFLVVANLHKEIPFKDVPLLFPGESMAALGLLESETPLETFVLQFTDRLGNQMVLQMEADKFAIDRRLEIPEIPALTACYFEITRAPGGTAKSDR